MPTTSSSPKHDVLQQVLAYEWRHARSNEVEGLEDDEDEGDEESRASAGEGLLINGTDVFLCVKGEVHACVFDVFITFKESK